MICIGWDDIGLCVCSIDEEGRRYTNFVRARRSASATTFALIELVSINVIQSSGITTWNVPPFNNSIIVDSEVKRTRYRLLETVLLILH